MEVGGDKGLGPIEGKVGSNYKIRATEVYLLVRRIPKGKVTTYKLLAEALGRPRASRAVGRVLHSNPTPLLVPCHRVVRSDGGLGGYSLGLEEKVRLLKGEGIQVRWEARRGEYRIIGLEKFLWRF